MPRRREAAEAVKTQPQPAAKPAGGKYSDLVDLSYLPTEYVDRIDQIFDGYFHLGMKKSNWHQKEEASPRFPNKLAALSSPELGDQLGEYTAWYSFAADKLKYIAVAHNFIEQELTKALEAELGNMVADKGNIEAKKAKAKTSEAYKLVYSYMQKLRGVKTMLEMEMDNYDRCISTLSREVTRRESNAGY